MAWPPSHPSRPGPASKPFKGRWGLAAWLALLFGLVVWGASQPPGRIEPVSWIGTIDI